jgi:hypothetical protein
MSDTEDNEELVENKSISSIKQNIINELINTSEESNMASIIEIISDLLVKICEENKPKKHKRNILLKSFTCKTIPSINIKDYFLRLSKNSKINHSTIIVQLIYIDRICKMNNVILTYYNIHKLILAAFVLAIKYNEDTYYSNIDYSKIGGVSVIELNNLEFQYLILIDFKLFVQTELFYKYYNDIMSLKDLNNEEEEEYDEEYEEENEEEVEDKKVV